MYFTFLKICCIYQGQEIITIKYIVRLSSNYSLHQVLPEYKIYTYAPTGETIEIVGVSIARVTDDLKIESLEHYFDNNVFLQKLTAGGCPFHSPNQNNH